MRVAFLPFAAAILAVAPLAAATPFDPLVKVYSDGVKKVNEEHLRKPGKDREPEIGKKLPAPARAALEKLLKAKDGPGLTEALVACGEAALDLDLSEDFGRIRARLEKSFPDEATRLGTALSRPRYILRGLNGVDDAYLADFAGIFDAILGAYDEVFGFKEWSKVPGKKIRVRIHREESIDRPPHFAPQFPYHSEIDFPVLEEKALTSPSAKGHFFFYGLCHELGHLIAMWGNMNLQEDHHSWAHYTGVTIVERLAETAGSKPFMGRLRDVRWRSLKKEREDLAGMTPSLKDAKGVLALLIALHDKVGPKAIGEAINLLDAQGKGPRINRVRYYGFKDFQGALQATLKNPKAKKEVQAIFAASRP